MKSGTIVAVVMAFAVGGLAGVAVTMADDNLQPAPKPPFDIGYGASCHATVDISAGPATGSTHSTTQDDQIETSYLTYSARRCLSRFVKVAAHIGVPGEP